MENLDNLIKKIREAQTYAERLERTLEALAAWNKIFGSRSMADDIQNLVGDKTRRHIGKSFG